MSSMLYTCRKSLHHGGIKRLKVANSSNIHANNNEHASFLFSGQLRRWKSMTSSACLRGMQNEGFVKPNTSHLRQYLSKNAKMSSLYFPKQLLHTSYAPNRIFFSTATKTKPAASTPALVEMSTQSQVLYAITGGLVITLLSGLSYMHSQVGSFTGLQRSLSFYSIAIPRYLEYRLLMIFDKPNKDWDELHQRASSQGLQKVLDLGGFYIKTGQMAASNIGNAFPLIWQERFSILQDQCPFQDFEVVKQIVEEDYGKTLDEVFEWFEEKPVGSASIGQVHRATLKNGDSVVVKVMYPDVESIFRGDVRTLKLFCQVAQPVHVPALDQVEKHFMTEFDYRKEAKQQMVIRRNMILAGLAVGMDEGDENKEVTKRKKEEEMCAIPKVYPDLCTKRVLVMEEFKGEKLADALRRDAETHALRQGLTPAQFHAREEALDQEARAKGELRMGPTAKEYDTYIELMDAKRKWENWLVWLRQWVLFGGGGRRRRSERGETEKGKEEVVVMEYQGRDTLPLNHARLMDELIYIFGYQALVNGYFNGDPHPGNVLLLHANDMSLQQNQKYNRKQNNNSRPLLGLIDYGQVGILDKEHRLLLCKLIIALADEDREEILRLMKIAGFRSKRMDPEVIYKYAKVYYDEDHPQLTGGLHIQLFVEDLERTDPILQIPDAFIMLGRASIMLRGLAHALHQSRSVAKAWRELAVEVLEREGCKDDLAKIKQEEGGEKKTVKR